MFTDFKCVCGAVGGFEVYHSMDKIVCSKCRKLYKISELSDKVINIKHQRG